MRIAVCGQKEIAIKCTETLLENNVNIEFIAPNTSDTGEDTWQPSFKKWGKINNIKVINSDFHNLMNFINSCKIDLMFSIYYDKILKKELINSIPLGIINTHLSPLPKYRGIAPVTFAILNGEKKHGVSLHYVDEGVDRGDVIAQKFFNIDKLKANEAFELSTQKCIELFNENIADILKNKHKRFKQDNSQATYFSINSINWSKDTIIYDIKKFFKKDTNSLYNWFRAFIFPPLQYPKILINNEMYEVIDISPNFEFNKFERPGTIIFIKNINPVLIQASITTHDSYMNLKIRKLG